MNLQSVLNPPMSADQVERLVEIQSSLEDTARLIMRKVPNSLGRVDALRKLMEASDAAGLAIAEEGR